MGCPNSFWARSQHKNKPVYIAYTPLVYLLYTPLTYTFLCGIYRLYTAYISPILIFFLIFPSSKAAPRVGFSQGQFVFLRYYYNCRSSKLHLTEWLIADRTIRAVSDCCQEPHVCLPVLGDPYFRKGIMFCMASGVAVAVCAYCMAPSRPAFFRSLGRTVGRFSERPIDVFFVSAACVIVGGI